MAEVQVLDSWQEPLEWFDRSRKDIYYDEGYVSLYAGGDVKERCFLRTDGDAAYLMPYLEHPNALLGDGRFDVSTPYGYGGPVSTSDDPRFLAESSEAMYRTLAESGAVAGFLRCHPILATHERLDERWNVAFDRQTVGVDLSRDEADIWEHCLNTKGRNRVRKGEAGGLRFEVDLGFEDIDDFMHVYYEAMRLVDASPFYYFEREYFERIRDRFAGRAFVGKAKLDDVTTSAMLFLCDGTYCHAHLSGSLGEYRTLGPNNFMLYHSILFAKKRGCKMFHLGGGVTNNPDDTLLRFKGCFSRERFEFHLGRAVFDEGAYRRAQSTFAERDPEGFSAAHDRFPQYGLLGPAA